MSDPSAQSHTNESRHIISETESLRQDIKMLEAERDRLREELQRTAAQRTSYEVVEEEGTDEYADYQGAYDIIIEQTRAALTQREGGDDE